MTRSDRADDAITRAADFWNEQHSQPDPAHDNFLEHPMVQAYISLRAFGSLIGHLEAVVGELQRRSRPGDRIVSVGCGAAVKERILARRLRDREFVGIDVAAETLERARAECADEGLDNVELMVADFNRLELPPRSFRVVLGLGAIHHVERLEHFWRACAEALEPDGAVLGQEYVGPNRLQWTEQQCEVGNRALAELVPEPLKPHHSTVVPVPIEVILELDPSEAVRSREILSTCEQAGFSIEGQVGAGCALLQPVLMNQISAYDPQDWRHNLVLARLFAEEERLMKDGVLGDDFVMFVARPPC